MQSEPYGTVTFGRQFDVVNDLLGPLSAASNTWGGNIAAHPFENDNLAADSVVVNNTVKYVSPTFAGITGEAMYSFSNKAGGFANNRVYGFSASYSQGPVNLAAGYIQFNNPGGGVTGTNPNGAISQGGGSANFIARRQRIWGVGGNYTFGVTARAPRQGVAASIAVTTLASLAILGGHGARVGGAKVGPGKLRVAFWSALSMGLASAGGAIVGTS